MGKEVKKLEMPDAHYLSASIGWLELGDVLSAAEELERISQKHQRHPHVLQAQLAISTSAARWDVAAESAAALRDLQPKDVNWWVTLAYATRRMRGGGLSAAKAVLLKAEKKFPRESIIPYNLACYSCQLGALDEARAFLEKCFTLGDPKQLRNMAAKDLDLEILWPELTNK